MTISFRFDGGGWCLDDVKGGELPMALVKEARKGEIDGFSGRRVYTVVPRYEALQNNAKIIGVRWVDTRKGDGVRSRLVCTDFNRDKGHTDDMFAPTPPLLASRWVVSRCASQGVDGMKNERLMSIDFTKAFFYTARLSARSSLNCRMRMPGIMGV